MGLTGLSSTSSVGAITPADVNGFNWFICNFCKWFSYITSNPTIDLTGLSMTSATGAFRSSRCYGINRISATSSTGSLTPADVMGLTGVSATASISPMVWHH